MKKLVILGLVVVAAVSAQAELKAIVVQSGSNEFYEVDLDAGTSQYLGTSSSPHNITAIDYSFADNKLYGISGIDLVDIGLSSLNITHIASVRPSNSLAIDGQTGFLGHFGGNHEFSRYDLTTNSVTVIGYGAYTNGIAINGNEVLRYLDNGSTRNFMAENLNASRDELTGFRVIPFQLFNETVQSIDHWKDDTYFFTTSGSKIYKLDLDRETVSFVMELPQYTQSDYSIAIIPEPTTLLLFALGGLILRKKK